jgi:phosphohistidine phosphatase
MNTKEIFIVRHAKSDWENNASGPDFDRPLNARGRYEAAFMSELMLKHALRPDLIVTSAAERARTTAYFFAKVFEIDLENVIEKSTMYECTVPFLHAMIRELPENADRVYLFGHNFTFSELAQSFSKKNGVSLATCTVVKVSGEVQTWADFTFPKCQIEHVWAPGSV